MDNQNQKLNYSRNFRITQLSCFFQHIDVSAGMVGNCSNTINAIFSRRSGNNGAVSLAFHLLYVNRLKPIDILGKMWYNW